MRFFNDWNTRRQMRTRGQALILIVMTFMGMLLFLGLMVDLGQIFLAKGYLRRAADAGALAAAAQFREGQGIGEMTAAALEVAHINGIDPNTLMVQTCKDGTPGPDEDLCAEDGDIQRKKVRVTIEIDYPLTFLSLLNIYTVHLTETSVSEAAAMDVVLVIDVSESMTWTYDPDPSKDYWEDPANPTYCNPNHLCQPFEDVKTAATEFVTKILDRLDPDEEEDRLAIVTFADGWEDGSQGTTLAMNWTTDQNVAKAAINNLQVYDPGVICPFGEYGCNTGTEPTCPATVDDIPVGACTYAEDLNVSTGKRAYNRLSCARMADLDTADGGHWVSDPSAISACNTTNIGGGLYYAGAQFGVEKRMDALWVVVMLTDGAANATFGVQEDIGGASASDLIFPVDIDPKSEIIDNFPFGFCPDGTWVTTEDSNRFNPHLRYCQDGDVDVVHHWNDPAPVNYNADDFARDQAKYVACYATSPSASCFGIKGQGAVIFTIGLGAEIQVRDNDTANGTKPYGASLLRYIAALGDDGDAATDLCETVIDYEQPCGNYFFTPDGGGLDKVFEQIYSRIYTRLTA